MLIENRIKELNIMLPENMKPGAMYVPVKVSGNLLFVSGQIPSINGKPVYTGKVGKERSIEYAKEAARLCIVNMLASIKDYVGELDKIKEVLRIQCFVNSEVGFLEQHIVANSASQLLYDIFGEAGRHVRTAVGTNQLPMDVTVEIEGIFQMKEESYGERKVL
ncbi:MAG: putative translation initiation inhibitor, yjgF family [Clostridiales bacterium]|jgi:enamine deaminase RidA (YjgF/YER057c/UK114 family)|nr:putative translation initiation inhibitor, yjgF family [Clostridiales bacterium]